MFETDKAVWLAVRNHLGARGYVVSDEVRVEVSALARSFVEDGASLRQAVEWATDLVVRRKPGRKAG